MNRPPTDWFPQAVELLTVRPDLADIGFLTVAVDAAVAA